MKRTYLIWICSILALGTVILLGWLYQASLGPSYSDTGTDFGFEGNGVRTVFDFAPKRLAPGDSLDVVIKLKDIPGNPPHTVPVGLANEAGLRVRRANAISKR